MSAPASKPPAEHEILNQSWFKSVGPRTYAAQVKKAGNGNHFLVLTEGKRDDKTGEVRKTRLFLFSEDFAAFFKMMHDTAVFIRENPVPEKVKRRQERKWAKQDSGSGTRPEKKQSPERPAASYRPGPSSRAGAPGQNNRSSRQVAAQRSQAAMAPAGR